MKALYDIKKEQTLVSSATTTKAIGNIAGTIDTVTCVYEWNGINFLAITEIKKCSLGGILSANTHYEVNAASADSLCGIKDTIVKMFFECDDQIGLNTTIQK